MELFFHTWIAEARFYDLVNTKLNYDRGVNRNVLDLNGPFPNFKRKLIKLENEAKRTSAIF